MEKQPTIDGYTRQDLWDRLEQANHFDWCRKEEYRRLRALFFDGVIEDAPDEYTREVELVWSPRTGSAHWQSVLDARCRFRDTDTGEIEYHPQWGKSTQTSASTACWSNATSSTTAWRWTTRSP
jgi:hypothetical protein